MFVVTVNVDIVNLSIATKIIRCYAFDRYSWYFILTVIVVSEFQCKYFHIASQCGKHICQGMVFRIKTSKYYFVFELSVTNFCLLKSYVKTVILIVNTKSALTNQRIGKHEKKTESSVLKEICLPFLISLYYTALCLRQCKKG